MKSLVSVYIISLGNLYLFIVSHFLRNIALVKGEI